LATTRLVSDLDPIVAAAGCKNSGWIVTGLDRKDLLQISSRPGVYLFVLPESALPEDRTLILHGRTFGPKGNKRQIRARFTYQPNVFGDFGGMVLYVGKAASIKARISGHLSTNIEATTNQVLRGIVGGAREKLSEVALKSAKKTLVELGKVYYIEHFIEGELVDYSKVDEIGACGVAERDLLEIKLIARFAPPFNIKAER
jgi:hypothetical protein